MMAVVFYLVCTAGQCERFEPAVWVDPTAAEVAECRAWAGKLVNVSDGAGCEVKADPLAK